MLNPSKLLRLALESRRASARLFLAFGAAIASQFANAFPPAPYFTIYGDVRDAYGNLIPAGDASVILYNDGREILRQALADPDGSDHNYQLRLRLDMMRAATGNYSSIALDSGSEFTIAIDIGGQLFYPLEIDTPPTIGNPAERRRFDLTLGVDTDEDGLPDAWEESQLYLAGIESGPDGWDLSLIDKDSDFNGDGIANWAEYTAGTYSGDESTTLELAIKDISDTSTRLEFYAIFGRIYSVETSTDLAEWTPVPIAFNEQELLTSKTLVLKSETTGVVSLYAPAAGSNVFYQLVSR